MPFQQDVRIDYWNLLKRRKRSIRNFLDMNGIDNEKKFHNWLKENTSQYIFSEEFKKEVLNHIEVKVNVKVKEKTQSSETTKKQDSETKKEDWSEPVLSPEIGVAEIEFTISPTPDSGADFEEENLSSNKKSKKKKYSNITETD